MGPINLAKIKAAHRKLMRLDPDFAAQISEAKMPRNRERLSLSADDHFAALADKNFRSLIDYADGTLQRISDRSIAASVNTASQPPRRRSANFTHAGKVGALYHFAGKRCTIRQLAEMHHMPVVTLRSRLRRGMTMEEAVLPRSPALHEFAGKSQTLAEWAEEAGVRYGTLQQRLYAGWSLEAALTVRNGRVGGDRRRDGGWEKTSQNASGTAFDRPADSAAK